MTDRIVLRDIRLDGRHGVHDEERINPQPFEVDVELTVDVTKAGESDALDDTVDYGVLCTMVERIITTDRFTLLERLASRISEVALADERVQSVTVSVRKLEPLH